MLALVVVLAGTAGATRARATDAPRGPSGPPAPSALVIDDAEILGEGAKKPFLRITSTMMRMSGYVQDGRGYQSKDGPRFGPGSERLTVFQPQIDVTAQQGDRLTHRVWIPIDIVTAASPNAIDKGLDVMSAASRQNEAGTVDWTVTYKHDADTSLGLRNGVHLEEDFRSWHGGLSVTRAFADQATTLSASALEVIDWFDRFDIWGGRHGRATRASTTLTAGLTQILTPTTVANASYGMTLQSGQLGTTWNSVPLVDGRRGPELLPEKRVRHALVGRFSQALPWNGVLKGYYRLYSDDWSILGHSVEGQLLQRLTDAFYVGATYRFHTQDGARFFTTRATPQLSFRTADSDLAPLDAHSVSGKAVLDVPLRPPGPRSLHVELAYERYWRDPDLTMSVFTCATGFTF